MQNAVASLTADAVHRTQVKTMYSNTEIKFAKSTDKLENEPHGIQDYLETSTLSSVSGLVQLLDSSSTISSAQYSSESSDLSEKI